MTAIELPVTAMVLVGGLGKRLRPIVSDRPKPMAGVSGTPFLEILIDSLARKGVRDFVLLTGYMGDLIEDYFSDRYAADLRIRFSRETRPLGTGGAVSNAAAYAGDPTLIVYGDTFFDADPKRLYDFHLDRRGKAALSLYRVEDVSRYGSALTGPGERITAFTEKGETTGRSGLINAGFYLLSGDFLRELPRGSKFSMERDVFPSLAEAGEMFGLEQRGAFFDIGSPESYKAFQRYVATTAE